MTDQSAGKAKRRSHWLLWWQLDQNEIARQVEGYYSLPFFKTARGIAVICYLVSIVITMLFLALHLVPLIGAVDIAVMLVLGFFIYRGHRWAMIAAMIVWTLEKVLSIVGNLIGQPAHGPVVITSIIWWAIYMHAFYLAFSVEQRRRGQTLAPSPKG